MTEELWHCYETERFLSFLQSLQKDNMIEGCEILEGGKLSIEVQKDIFINIHDVNDPKVKELFLINEKPLHTKLCMRYALYSKAQP